MSIAEIERFAADLRSNETLRAEAEKAATGTSHATPAEGAVAFAASKGYAFTADDANRYVKSRLLSDAELDGVTGGWGWANWNAMSSAADANNVTASARSQISSTQTINQQLTNQVDRLNSAKSRWDTMLTNL